MSIIATWCCLRKYAHEERTEAGKALSLCDIPYSETRREHDEKEHRVFGWLFAVWLVVATLAALAVGEVARSSPAGASLQPLVYRYDGCPDTCTAPCPGGWRRHQEGVLYYCCVPDQGCWANPLEPDFQKAPCKRDVYICRGGEPAGVQQRVEPQSIPPRYCCSQYYQCGEENGQPCCEPRNDIACP